MNEADNIIRALDLLPINEDKRKEILELSTNTDYRALLINQLILTVDQTIETEFQATKVISEAKAITRLLKLSLKTPKLNEPIKK